MPPAAALPPARVIAIGASTGGPAAITDVLRELPRCVHAPILIVQHMPAQFTQRLAERLAERTARRVREAEHDELVLAGSVYVAPGDMHMRVRRDGFHVRITLDRDTPEHSCRPAVDVLLRSVAAAYGASTLAVILTGMGSDGAVGCEAVRRQGGFVIAQDCASSVVWGMPGLVVRSGFANSVLPLQSIAEAIAEHVSYASSQLAANTSEGGAP